jgi:hypothetical protein
VDVCGGCDVAAAFDISMQFGYHKSRVPGRILTVLSAGRRDCRSFVGAVVHDVGVWGSEFPILRGGSSGAVLSEWSVRDSLTSSRTSDILPAWTSTHRIHGLEEHNSCCVRTLCIRSEATYMESQSELGHHTSEQFSHRLFKATRLRLL